MARFNNAVLIGKVVNEVLEPKIIGKDQTDGKKPNAVLNFLIEYFDTDDKRTYKLPVAVWGVDEVMQCKNYLNKGDLVLVQGEVRYKFIKDPITKEIVKIYTTVKASTVEFLSKKLKNQALEYAVNEVKLIGNLVGDACDKEEGFVVAVDRLYPTKEATLANEDSTDFITLVVRDKKKIKGNLKKGSVVIVDGKLMTRRRHKELIMPTIVVDVKEMVGR